MKTNSRYSLLLVVCLAIVCAHCFGCANPSNSTQGYLNDSKTLLPPKGSGEVLLLYVYPNSEIHSPANTYSRYSNTELSAKVTTQEYLAPAVISDIRDYYLAQGFIETLGADNSTTFTITTQEGTTVVVNCVEDAVRPGYTTTLLTMTVLTDLPTEP